MSEADRVVDAFLALVTDKEFASITLRDVASAADMSLIEVFRVYRNKAVLVSAFLARVDQAVLAGTPRQIDPEETARDRLFDVMMRRYDALKPHRPALQSIRRAVMRDPGLGLALAPALRRSMAAMLEAAALPSDGLSGAVRQHGLAAIDYAVAQVFERDETADLSKTMAALDGRLKATEKWAQAIGKYRFFGQRRPSKPVEA